jgi:hypothetical protein
MVRHRVAQRCHAVRTLANERFNQGDIMSKQKNWKKDKSRKPRARAPFGPRKPRPRLEPRVLQGEEQARVMNQFLAEAVKPYSETIALITGEGYGVAVIAHKPRGVSVSALRTLGWDGEAPVFDLSGGALARVARASAAAGHRVMADWLTSGRPLRHFVFWGERTLLINLTLKGYALEPGWTDPDVRKRGSEKEDGRQRGSKQPDSARRIDGHLAHANEVNFLVSPKRNGDQRCIPAHQLASMLDAGQLPRFAAVWAKPSHDGLGDCHEVASALMTDLIVAGRSAGWCWCTGVSPAHGESGHSWLECEGWAVDTSNGAERGGTVLCSDVGWYRGHQQFTDVTVRDGQATRDWHLGRDGSEAL